MKLTAPKSPDEYFEQTEHAMKHAYAGLDSCWAYYQEALQYADPGIREGRMIHYLPPRTPEEKAKLSRYLELARKYFELKFSEAMLAGSILEAAYMAIRIYSRNTAIPASCVTFVKPSKKDARQFCIGRERHGVPIGLIVYAGRNQFAHWDEKKLGSVNKRVFAVLSDAFQNNPFSDLAFDLGNPTINIYASEVLFTALGWTTYDNYLADMSEILHDATAPSPELHPSNRLAR